MQLNRTTDYVVRIVYFLSNENRIFTSEEISEAIGCSRGYVISILRKLSKEGLVEVIRGVKGGFRLKKRPDAISLFDGKRLIFRYDRKNPRLLFSSRSTLTVHI